MKKDFFPFMLEREMSIWEHQVKYNLSESGVHPMTVEELLGGDSKLIEDLLQTSLNYPQTNGSIELRDRIAALYKGATRDNVVVTTGAAQANFTSIISLLDPGDEIVVMLPNYMQIYGLAKNYRLKVKTFSLKEEINWGVDIDELNKVVGNKTVLIAVCNPNNPTGHIMVHEEREAVIRVADQVGAWILADEVYAGAEHHTDEVTASFWGDYEKVLAIGSLSKAYALPGLRVGWVVAPKDTTDEIWARQDYVTITNTMLANKLATHALSPGVREKLLTRTRKYLREGYSNFERWCRHNEDLVSFTPPDAAAIAFVRYHRDVSSSEIVRRLIHERDTYVVPGDHFGMDHHLRISYGLSEEYVNEGLSRIIEIISSYKSGE